MCRKLAAVFFISICTAPAAFAIDQREIEGALQKHECPAEAIDTRGMPNFKLCTQYEPDWTKVNECQDEQSHFWQLALKYNALYRACHLPSHGAAEKDRPSGMALAKAAQDASLKAEETRRKAREAAAQAASSRNPDDSEKERLKTQSKDAGTSPGWCPHMVAACEERTNDMKNADQAAKTQCEDYCRMLRSENCDSTSVSLRYTAGACTARAERSQTQEIARERVRREEKRQQEVERQEVREQSSGRYVPRRTHEPQYFDDAPLGYGTQQSAAPSYQNPAPSPRYNPPAAPYREPRPIYRAAPASRYVPPPPPRFVAPAPRQCVQGPGRPCTVQ